MLSWVRYSVTVYLGLLLAGSIASPMHRGVSPGVSPGAGLRASYRTTAPVSDPKQDPISTQSDEVIGYQGAEIVWQSTARADHSR